MIVAVVGDPDGTRRVTAIIALLISIGIGLVMLAVWLHRVTRPDPEVLAPLELMGERAWRRGDPVWQRRRLDEVRPDGAEPLQPSAAPPEIDAAFDAGPTASGFDDLHDAPRAIPGDPLLSNRHGTPADATAAMARGHNATGSGFGPPVVPSVRLQQRPRVNLVDAPSGLPVPDARPEREIDPDLMAAAMLEIDSELREYRHGDRPPG